MGTKVINLKVFEINRNTGVATLVEPDEIDDVVKHEIFIPAHFGGDANPWPKVGDEITARYSGYTGNRSIIDCWPRGQTN